MGKMPTLILGVVTSIGGFVEAGSISTSAQAGAEFGFSLLWAIALAAVIVAMLSEMAGRVACVSRRSMTAAVRERFGMPFQIVPLVGEFLIDAVLLTAELGGAAIALKMLTGVAFPWWIVPIAAAAWLVLWLGGFSFIEDGVGLLGTITLSFVIAAWWLHPDPGEVARGFVPSIPDQGLVRYAFLAVGIVGATVSPYLLNFYSSGTIEEKLGEPDLWINRTTAYSGMGLGSVVSMGVLVAAAVVLKPAGVKADTYENAALMFEPVFGAWGTTIFALSLGVGCFGAAVEIALNAAYALAQSLGWSWGAEKPRRQAARFTVTFSLMLALAALIGVIGFDPLQLTQIALALTVVLMPLVVLPFLVLVNNHDFVRRHTSGPIGNVALALLTIAAALMALVVIPLQLMGG
jgi:Mn2+/Fe2+ NRAMP family transporter